MYIFVTSLHFRLTLCLALNNDGLFLSVVTESTEICEICILKFISFLLFLVGLVGMSWINGVLTSLCHTVHVCIKFQWHNLLGKRFVLNMQQSPLKLYDTVVTPVQ